jgi:hypothetical protein
MKDSDFFSPSLAMRKETTWHRILPFAMVLAVLLGVAALGVWTGGPKGDRLNAGTDRLYVGP